MIGEKSNSTEAIDINNLHQPEPLSKRVVRGGIWVFALRITTRGLGFIRTIILARLLAPEDFGLLGIATLSIAKLDCIGNSFFSPPPKPFPLKGEGRVGVVTRFAQGILW